MGPFSVHDVLNYNGKKFLEQFLPNVIANCDPTWVEIVVADTIKGALAHGSLLTTETYLKDFEIQELDNTLQKMFDKAAIKDKAIKLMMSLSPEDREAVIAAVKEQSENQNL